MHRVNESPVIESTTHCHIHSPPLCSSDLQHYPFQEPGTRLQLPGYPDPVSNFKCGRKSDNAVTCYTPNYRLFFTKIFFLYKTSTNYVCDSKCEYIKLSVNGNCKSDDRSLGTRCSFMQLAMTISLSPVIIAKTDIKYRLTDFGTGSKYPVPATNHYSVLTYYIQHVNDNDKIKCLSTTDATKAPNDSTLATEWHSWKNNRGF